MFTWLKNWLAVPRSLVIISDNQQRIFDLERKLMSALTDLQAEVARNQTIVTQLIAENKTGASDADLAALTASLKATNDTAQAALPVAPTV